MRAVKLVRNKKTHVMAKCVRSNDGQSQGFVRLGDEIEPSLITNRFSRF